MERRRLIKQISFFFIAFIVTYLLGSCQSTLSPQDTTITELTFGILATESPEYQKTVWPPFLEAMSSDLGVNVKPFYAQQYSSLVEAMRSEKVQVAWYGGKSYVDAAKVAEAEAFALTISEDGKRGYHAHLITHKDSQLVKDAEEMGGDKAVIQQAANLTFAFNDLDSTSGFLVPNYYLFTKNEIQPNNIFKQVEFLGNHGATALAVANQEVDVATNNNEALVRFENTYPNLRQEIAIIWTSVLIPSDPIAYRKDLPQEMKERIANFFYNYKDSEVLQPLEWSAFEPADDSTWNPIRELKIGQQILDIQNNPNIKPEAKGEMLKQLNQQLEGL